MEERFFYFPGQTPENTKVEDRGHGLHITANEWHKIKKNLDRKKDIQEELDKEESKRRYLDEGSKNMIKNWENSLENIRKRKQEERLKYFSDIQEDRMRRFFQLRDEQLQTRKEYVDKVRKKMFMDSGWARDINTAFKTSEVLFEREKQKDLKKFLKQHEADVEAEYAKVVRQNVKDEEDEKAAKARKLQEDRIEYGKYLRQIIQENEERDRIAEETRLKKESLDYIKSTKEIELIKKIEQNHREEQKRELNNDIREYLKSEEERKKQLKQEEKEVDEVLAIYQVAKQEIECLKREKVAEKNAGVLARSEHIAKLVMAGVAEKKAEEEARFEAARAQKEAIELATLKAKADHIENVRKDRTKCYNECLERKKEEKRKQTELEKWDMVNRYKLADYCRQYELDKKRGLWEDILKHRKEILDQMGEREKLRMEAQKMDECLSHVSYARDDAKFFDYADEVLELAKKKGRSTYPIEKTIYEYKQFYSLLPKGEKCTTCEDITMDGKKSLSREMFSTPKRKPCKCLKK